MEILSLCAAAGLARQSRHRIASARAIKGSFRVQSLVINTFPFKHTILLSKSYNRLQIIALLLRKVKTKNAVKITKMPDK